MDIICKTDVKDILTVGDIFTSDDGTEGIITSKGDTGFSYLELKSKSYAGKITSMMYECFTANNLKVAGNILNAKIAYKFKLGAFIPSILKVNTNNYRGSIVLTSNGRLAFMVNNEPRREYCELIYLEPPVDNNFSNVKTMKYFYSETDFLYRLASYRDYSLVLL